MGDTPLPERDWTGHRFGTFQITAMLGKGGMGEVFRARDLALGRDVAIKIISGDLGHDPARRGRFEREARLLASLNHPNIGAIHAIEFIDDAPAPLDGARSAMSGSRMALVLELIEGPTLADRLAAGPIPTDEAIDIARQIAEALGAAHDRGIVHRDLKPANVKVTPNGLVKVLDFGLAKALDADASSADADGSLNASSLSPTITALTHAGTVLGTSAYMSPEQTRGAAVGPDADIWAFGCVLYEMLTGRRAFKGDTISETIAAVLTAEPDWTPFANMPTPLETLVRRCLEKNPRRRLHDIADAAIWLDEVRQPTRREPPSPASGNVTPRRPARRTLPWIAGVAVAALAFAAGAAVVKLSQPRSVPPPLQTLRFELKPSPDAPFTAAVTGGNLVISNDGLQIVYHVLFNDRFRLMARRLDSLEAAPVPGSDLARNPFFSPDGKRIGFISNGVIRTVVLDTGVQTTVAPVEGMATAVWSDDGTIAFTGREGLFRVPEAGGTPQLILRPDGKSTTGIFTVFPLPGGALMVGMSAPVGGLSYLGGLLRGSSEPKRLIDGVAIAGYTQGALIYPQPKGATARAFDPKTLEFSGPPVLVDIGNTTSGGFAFSRNGTFAYTRGADRESVLTRVVLLNASGQVVQTIAEDVVVARQPRVSPDGRHLAVSIGPNNVSSIWNYDLSGAAQPLKLTTTPRYAGEVPVWRPDGRELALMWRSSQWGMALLPPDGTAERPTLLDDTIYEGVPQEWSADGKTLLIQSTDAATKTDLMTFDLATKTSRPWLKTEFYEGEARISPDGRWVAYASDQTGRSEIWTRSYPSAGPPVRISSEGGHEPVWARDGKTIFYQAGTRMMAASFQATATSATAGQPHMLFDGGFIPFNYLYRRTYDVLPDGRFVVVQRARTVTPESLVIVLNALQPLAVSR